MGNAPCAGIIETAAAWGDAQDYIPPSPLSCMVGARSAARVPDARGTFEGAGSIARNTREEQGQDVREARAVTATKCIPIAILLLCLAAPLLAAGCVSGGDDDVAVVEYHRTGGIAGFDDRLVIYENGTATVSRHGTFTTFSPDPQALARVRAIVASEAFQSLEESYLPQQQGYDLISYEVTAGRKHVRAEDGAVPAALEPLITELNEIIRESTAP